MSGPSDIRVSPAALDTMMPMHVIVGADERIEHVGPTLAKIHPGKVCIGQRFFDLFEPRRPRHIARLTDICAQSRARFSLRLGDAARTPLTGTAVRLDAGGVLVNLSFGIAVIDAVARFNLAGSDFAATDLTLELLYLVEANAAAMAESRKLNDRLQGAMVVAAAEAQSDTLTGLSNRRALDRMLHRHVGRGISFALMHLDLDFFKQVNDTFGHAAGDRVLTEVALILKDEIRAEDVVARMGGDEFVLIFSGLTDHARLSAIAARLIERIEAPVRLGDRSAQVSASIGLAVSTDYGAPDAATMMHDADRALYASKARGRACYTFHGDGAQPAGRVMA
jgi:diguanylate cyclase (GGDEF)-like protein